MTIFKVGKINMPDRTFALPGTEDHSPVVMPVYCYLIEHEKGLVLVDAGVANEDLGVVEPGQDIVSQLETIGFDADDIDFLVMTHMHLDHAAYMDSFPNSTVVVRGSELSIALDPPASEGGYVISQYRLLTSDSSLRKVVSVPDDADFDLFGDGSIVLTDTRGHSAGHQSVVVNLLDSGRFLIVGDAAYFHTNLDGDILPGRCTSDCEAHRSLEKLHQIEQQGVTLLFGHDPDQE
ncbi:MAG: N-acyl homoserine lactonase family protein, partial [Coriobacteriales bacterium]